MLPHVPQLDPVRQPVTEQLTGRGGHHHLATVSEIEETRRPVNGGTEVVAVPFLRLTGVEGHPHPQTPELRELLLGEGASPLGCRALTATPSLNCRPYSPRPDLGEGKSAARLETVAKRMVYAIVAFDVLLLLAAGSGYVPLVLFVVLYWATALGILGMIHAVEGEVHPKQRGW